MTRMIALKRRHLKTLYLALYRKLQEKTGCQGGKLVAREGNWPLKGAGIFLLSLTLNISLSYTRKCDVPLFNHLLRVRPLIHHPPHVVQLVHSFFPNNLFYGWPRVLVKLLVLVNTSRRHTATARPAHTPYLDSPSLSPLWPQSW